MPNASQTALRLWRLAALAVAAWLIHFSAARLDSGDAIISLGEARAYFPAAARLSPRDSKRGGQTVFDSSGTSLGYVVTTSPETDDLVGYAGPSNLRIALDATGRVIGVELLSSGDTRAHVEEVRRNAPFWKQFAGWMPATQQPPKVDGVGGSTLTSLAMAESVERKLAGKTPSLRFPDAVTLEEVRALFTNAASFSPDGMRDGWFTVNDARGTLLGRVVRTSPYSDNVRGHGGPTESLAALGPDGRGVIAVRLRRSYDTADYVDRVREDDGFLRQLAGRTVAEWAQIDFKRAGIEGVSGATETSYAVAEGLRRRFIAEMAPPAPTRGMLKARDWALLGVLAGAAVMAFSSLRGHKWARLGWQAVLIGVFGMWIGDLLSVAMFAGWARNGVAWQTAPALVLLGAVALLVPWGTRRQIYCHHLCPHGAAQEWLGHFKRLHWRVPKSADAALRVLPGLLLAGAFLVAVAGFKCDLAGVEPFDAWTLRGAAMASAAIAVAGLVAALFVPQAYCRYGCPTGALLKFVRTTGGDDRFGARDWFAVAALVVALVVSRFNVGAGASSETILRGGGFGTTWSVTLHGTTNAAALRAAIADEVERIESTLSHWRTNSATAQFNAATTTQPMEVPAELAALVSRGQQISRASAGAFDLTVAPLVKAYGHGPGGAPAQPPGDDELARLRARVGWGRLAADTNENTLRKSEPRLQIDLGGILQGHAADRIAALLDAAGQTNYLIDVGGELLARGAWTVAVEDPRRAGAVLRRVVLRDAALATSGTYRAAKAGAESSRSHLIDPATGRPVAHDTVLVSVVHPSCAAADAWATALLVAGADRAVTFAGTNGVEFLAVRGTNGLRSSTPGFPAAR
jgi:thiamine biosynthesis lipoprotein ApbE